MLCEMNAEMVPYFDAYLLLTETGLLPWEAGNDLPRQRFYEAAEILAGRLGLRRLVKTFAKTGGCPLLG